MKDIDKSVVGRIGRTSIPLTFLSSVTPIFGCTIVRSDPSSIVPARIVLIAYGMRWTNAAFFREISYFREITSYLRSRRTIRTNKTSLEDWCSGREKKKETKGKETEGQTVRYVYEGKRDV